MNLWPHQIVALDRALDAIKRSLPSGLVASPTGTGKTRLFVELARRLGWRVDAWVAGLSKREASEIIGELKKCVA